MYKLVFLVFCLIQSSLTADGPDFEAALKTCSPNFPNVPKDTFDVFCESSYSTTDKDTKCLVKCVGEATGFGAPDGKLLIPKFMNMSTPEDAAKYGPELTKCGALSKPDPCDTAYDQWKCFCAAVVMDKKP